MTATFGLQAIGIGTVIGIPGSLEPFFQSAGDFIGFPLAGNKWARSGNWFAAIGKVRCGSCLEARDYSVE
jgi:hypothetical protein